MFILMVAPYLLLHIPVTWGTLYQATCLFVSCTYYRHCFQKAHQRAGLILRTFISRDIRLLMRAFSVYVRITQLFGHPLLPVILMLWNQYNVVSPRLPTLKNLSYCERLKCLNIFSLELRPLHTPVLICFGVIKLLLVWFMLILMTCLFLAPASTLVVINLNSTSDKPLAAFVPISLVSE